MPHNTLSATSLHWWLFAPGPVRPLPGCTAEHNGMAGGALSRVSLSAIMEGNGRAGPGRGSEGCPICWTSSSPFPDWDLRNLQVALAPNRTRRASPG
jgi:hypothetical protein